MLQCFVISTVVNLRLMELQVGDTVQLKSGGPLMTVDYIVGQNPEDEILFEDGMRPGDVICQWFCDDRVQGKSFRPQVLLKVEFCVS